MTQPGQISPAKAKRIDRNRQLRDALELRKAGVPYATIAERLGWNSPQAAHKAVQKAMKQMVNDSVEEVKAIELERLNHLFMLAWAKAQNGDLRAIETAVRINERISAMRGLDAPRETNVKHSGVLVIDGEDEDEYIASLSAIDGGQVA